MRILFKYKNSKFHNVYLYLTFYCLLKFCVTKDDESPELQPLSVSITIFFKGGSSLASPLPARKRNESHSGSEFQFNITHHQDFPARDTALKSFILYPLTRLIGYTLTSQSKGSTGIRQYGPEVL